MARRVYLVRPGENPRRERRPGARQEARSLCLPPVHSAGRGRPFPGLFRASDQRRPADLPGRRRPSLRPEPDSAVPREAAGAEGGRGRGAVSRLAPGGCGGGACGWGARARAGLGGRRVPGGVAVVGLFLVLLLVTAAAALTVVVPAISQVRAIVGNPQAIAQQATALSDQAQGLPFVGQYVTELDQDRVLQLLRSNAPSAGQVLNVATGGIGGGCRGRRAVVSFGVLAPG